MRLAGRLLQLDIGDLRAVEVAGQPLHLVRRPVGLPLQPKRDRLKCAAQPLGDGRLEVLQGGVGGDVEGLGHQRLAELQQLVALGMVAAVVGGGADAFEGGEVEGEEKGHGKGPFRDAGAAPGGRLPRRASGPPGPHERRASRGRGTRIAGDGPQGRP